MVLKINFLCNYLLGRVPYLHFRKAQQRPHLKPPPLTADSPLSDTSISPVAKVRERDGGKRRGFRRRRRRGSERRGDAGDVPEQLGGRRKRGEPQVLPRPQNPHGDAQGQRLLRPLLRPQPLSPRLPSHPRSVPWRRPPPLCRHPPLWPFQEGIHLLKMEYISGFDSPPLNRHLKWRKTLLLHVTHCFILLFFPLPKILGHSGFLHFFFRFDLSSPSVWLSEKWKKKEGKSVGLFWFFFKKPFLKEEN